MVEEGKIYLTKEGLKRLEQEYRLLKKKKEIKTKDEAPTNVSSQGFDSEFSTFQEDLGLLEARAEELENIFKNYVSIVPPPKYNRKTIFIGATVTLEVGGQIDEFTIVGSLEANPTLGKISNESMVGKLLLGHKVGDQVKVESGRVVIYRIQKIRYKL